MRREHAVSERLSDAPSVRWRCGSRSATRPKPPATSGLPQAQHECAGGSEPNSKFRMRSGAPVGADKCQVPLWMQTGAPLVESLGDHFSRPPPLIDRPTTAAPAGLGSSTSRCISRLPIQRASFCCTVALFSTRSACGSAARRKKPSFSVGSDRWRRRTPSPE